MTVFFHAIIRRQSIGRGPNSMGSVAIYRDSDETDGAIAEPSPDSVSRRDRIRSC